jgi:hypothetical protein
MEHAPDSDLSLSASWRCEPAHRLSVAATVEAALRILTTWFETQPRMAAVGSAWLREHEVDCGKRGQA